MHARQVFSHDPQSKQLSAREQRDNRGEERKARHRAPLHELAHHDLDEHGQSEEREDEADEAGKPQRPRLAASRMA